MWGRKAPPAPVSLSETHESCGELSAVAQLVATTPISASVFGIRESQSKNAQENFLLNPDDLTEEDMVLVFSSTIANHCERQIVSMS